MKILVVGATGTIGSEVVRALSRDHEVIPVSHSHGHLRVDLADPSSIEALYERVGRVDAVVCAAGEARFGPLDELTDEDFSIGLRNKLMGQVDLVRRGTSHVTDGGSFTLTGGILARRPMPGAAAIGLVNAGLEGFARNAALELPRGQRMNVVSPGWVAETLEAMGRDPSGGTPAAVVARTYRESVEGDRSGEVLVAEGSR